MTGPADDEVGRRSVLVVEDEYILAMELESALILAGFTVLGPAGSIDLALNLINEQRPNAAILDVTIGGEVVTPVALLLKSLHVPFILASASTAAELARYEVLADVHNVGKPTDMKRLVSLVRGL